MATQQSVRYDDALASLAHFPFFEALMGRRSRRFAVGATLPDGPLAFRSPNPPQPLDELEELLVLSAVGGNTGWNFGIMRAERYAPHLSNYAGAAGGRTFPSPAGWHTSDFFYTNDAGVYFFSTKDVPALVQPGASIEAFVTAQRARIRKIADRRLHIPATPPFMSSHNTWCANVPGSTLIIPVGDLAQTLIAMLCALVQNGIGVRDDVSGEPIRGMERFSDLIDQDNAHPLSFLEFHTATALTAELATANYAGALALQALGLGGWIYDGIDPFGVLGASGDPSYPGLGFRYDTDARWPIPNPTGLPGVFEAFTPPHCPDMRAAVGAFVQRKYGPGGPYNRETPGPWKDTPEVRSSALVHDEHFVDAVSTIAQHIYDTHGRFPATLPSVLVHTYLQAHHLELAFYDHHFGPGAYLESHAQHQAIWHSTNLTI
jgi:hypothetical protein